MEASVPDQAHPDVAIIGAGASGILLANALVRPPRPVRVVLVDPDPGRGVAYAGSDPHRLLNTRVGAMSLDAGQPLGFLEWLEVYRERPGGWSAEDFAPRSLFGDYLQHRLFNLVSRTPGLGSTSVTRSRAVAAERTANGWSVRLADGGRLQARTLVLAAGPARPRPLIFHGRGQIEAQVLDDPWDEGGLRGLPQGSTVLLIGTGLTALDAAEAVWRRDPEAKVLAVSRHGLLPRVHASPAASGPVLTAPYPSTARELYAKLRAAAEFVEGDGALRHGVFLGLREIAARLWSGLAIEERAMFLRHFRRYWEVERQRIPPAQAKVIQQAAADGRFEVVRGRLAEAKAIPSGQGARVALLTSQGPRALEAGRIINCTGPEPDPFRSRNPLLLDLLAQGAAATDPLGLGLDVDDDSHVLDAQGRPTPSLYALGSLTQGRFFEITGVAEIRAQAERLAGSILAGAPASPWGGAELIRAYGQDA
jgi:uncharacterized NAD(P)/FAD-binding protein YdhS